MIRVDLAGDEDIESEEAMNAQAVRNATRKTTPPLLAFAAEAGPEVESAEGEEDGSDDEVYEINANGKRIHGCAARNTKQVINRPPKAGDYDAHTKSKILLASALLTAIAASEDPFPTNEATIEMATFAWETVLEKLSAFPVDEQAEWYSVVRALSPMIIYTHDTLLDYPRFPSVPRPSA